MRDGTLDETADPLGRRRVLVAGITLYSIACLAYGLAQVGHLVKRQE